ncbi:hypothetical protein ACWDYJ_06130 [Streptomyces sp. NPDC003042]
MSINKRTAAAPTGLRTRVRRSETAATAAAPVAGGLTLFGPAPAAHAAASD